MEHALAEYYKAYENCLFSCEGSYELREFKDFYPAIAGEGIGEGVAIENKGTDAVASMNQGHWGGICHCPYGCDTTTPFFWNLVSCFMCQEWNPWENVSQL